MKKKFKKFTKEAKPNQSMLKKQIWVDDSIAEFSAEVKPFGEEAHIIVPKDYIGCSARVTIKRKDD